ncbi:MAG: glycosyl hydrolase, partial [Planctomycetota bacterium]
SMACGDHPKRGWAGSEQSMVTGTNVGWFYDWSDINAEPVTTSAEYLPMFYSAADVTAERIADVAVNYPNATHILGMNEPDQPSQGTSTVAEALSVWPMIESTGLRTVSPANLSDSGGRAWSRDFLNQADALGYRVDVVGVHWYGNFFSVDYTNPEQTATRFLNDIESWWTEYQKPLWITEFGVRDTSDQIDPELIGSHNERFLELVLPELDSRDYVERYAWFQWEHDMRLMDRNPITPTPLGGVYADAARPGVTIDFQGVSRGNDVLYVRGGTLTNTTRQGTAGGQFVEILASDADEVGVLQGVSNWTVADGYFWSRPGSAVRKEGANEVIIHDSEVFHSGAIEIAEGAIRLSGSTTISGVGSLTLLPGGTLALGGPNDTAPQIVSRSIAMDGGSVIASAGAVPGEHILRGTQTITATTRFEVESELEVRGALNGSNGAGIVKSGPGRLRIEATTSLDGDMIVEEGVLVLGPAASLEGSPKIEIATDAEIDVTSRRLGLAIGAGRELHAQPGAMVRGILDLDTDATIGTAIASAADSKAFSVTESLAAAGALIVSLEDDAPSPQAGDSFHLIDTPMLTGAFDSVDLPTLAAGLVWNDGDLLTVGTISVGLAGDFNLDGTVDTADYTVYRDNTTGDLTPADLAVWQSNFGATIANPPAAVPEPVTRGLLVIGLLGSLRLQPGRLR